MAIIFLKFIYKEGERNIFYRKVFLNFLFSQFNSKNHSDTYTGEISIY